MYRNPLEYTVLDDVTPIALASSTDATPIVVTVAGHSFSNGDLVLIFGHATNIAANGIYKVANIAATTFELTDRYTGADIAGTGGGAGGATGLVIPAPKILLVEDFQHIDFSVHTAGTATTTLKIAGSLGLLTADAPNFHGDTPNFGATIADDNPYAFIDFADLSGGGVVTDGDTGIVVAGTDINTINEVNSSGLKYVTIFPISWTAGSITIKAKVFNNS